MKKVVITTGLFAIAGGLATALFMPSCDPECEVQDKPSVIVRLVDQNAAGVTLTEVHAAEVWYEWTDEDGNKVEQKAECVDDECSEWMLGDGAPGQYAFHAKVCGRQFDSSITLELGQDGCSADTELVDLSISTVDCPDIMAPPPAEPPPPQAGLPTTERDVLAWQIGGESCTLEARFSVVASLFTERNGRMVPVGADRAYYILNPVVVEDGPGKGLGHDKHIGEGHDIGKGKGHDKDGDVVRGEELEGLCIDEHCTRFAAGIEFAGTILVGAEACGQSKEVTVEVGRTEDGCHVATQTAVLTFDGLPCKGEAVYEAPPSKPECPSTAPPPSAFVWPVYQKGDMLFTQGTEDLIYTVNGTRGRGTCAYETPNGKCGLWITGTAGETGDFVAYTATCGVESAIPYTVELDETGCFPDTRYVLASVDTHGCITPFSPEPRVPSDPAVPVAGTDVREP
jgi:hypothetical protein